MIACTVCAADPAYAECCDPVGHTETVQRLAKALGQSLAGPPGHPELHPEWYIEDAEAIVCNVTEGDGWIIEHDPGCLGEYFKVNGVEFWLDLNAEGPASPVLAADHRAEWAEEASWEDADE
jgi:hypothetical protein